MTDVEAKTPSKRKSTPNVQGKKGFAKKAKLVNTQTPQKGISPKKQNQIKPNGAQKFNKKNKRSSESENDSPKKLEPFPGTQAAATNEKIGKKGKVIEKKKAAVTTTSPDAEKKKKRRSQFHTLEQKAKQGNADEVVKTIESKMKEIQNRNELTKTAKRKLKRLARMKKIILGEPLGQPPQKAKTENSDSPSKKRRERKKNAVNKSSAVQKTSSEPDDAKVNGKGAAKKVQNKILAKAVSQVKIDKESEDEDENLEEAESGEEELSGEESDEESDNNEEEVEEEESDDEEENESEDDSEDDTPPPPAKVSNKRQKKK